jgi:hypothetical protein
VIAVTGALTVFVVVGYVTTVAVAASRAVGPAAVVTVRS